MNCRKILENLQDSLPLDGYLSIEHGFMPPVMPLNKLTGIYSLWDQYVAQIPDLYFTNQTQQILMAMPLLHTNSLKDSELPRAALALSILAHAYWRHGSKRAFAVRMRDIDGQLPETIMRPWTAVNQRLGRGDKPFQSFYDLFMNNFRLQSDPLAQGNYDHAVIKIENLEPLIPSFGNQAERVFYMSFVEMHAIASPLIGCIVDIEVAIENNNSESPHCVIKALDKITQIMQECIKTLRKISPIVNSKTYCDPVLWSKTVAIFAVPPADYPQGGTSGAFAPFILILDALLNRQKYDSEYGRFVLHGRNTLLPAHIMDFVGSVRQIDLVAFIKSYVDSPLVYDAMAKAYNETLDIYAGSDGFLTKHMSKAFNYLGVATMVGRNQSTSGHERFAHKETWVKVRQLLDESRLERYHSVDEIQSKQPNTVVKNHEELPQYSRLDVARHHTLEDCWVVIDDDVYDVTDYLKFHPGGYEIILAHAGKDVSTYFQSIPAHTQPKIQKILKRYRVGKFKDDTPKDGEAAPWYKLLDMLIFIRAILIMQYQQDLETRLHILFSSHTHMHFIHEHVNAIIRAIPHQTEHQVNEISQVGWETLKTQATIPEHNLLSLATMEILAIDELSSHSHEETDVQLIDTLLAFTLNVLSDKSYGYPTTALACLQMIDQWVDKNCI